MDNKNSMYPYIWQRKAFQKLGPAATKQNTEWETYLLLCNFILSSMKQMSNSTTSIEIEKNRRKQQAIILIC